MRTFCSELWMLKRSVLFILQNPQFHKCIHENADYRPETKSCLWNHQNKFIGICLFVCFFNIKSLYLLVYHTVLHHSWILCISTLLKFL